MQARQCGQRHGMLAEGTGQTLTKIYWVEMPMENDCAQECHVEVSVVPYVCLSIWTYIVVEHVEQIE